MLLKSVVDDLLKEKNRPMSWLAEEMGKTFDGLKLSLIRGSIKYNDLISMSNILEVSPSLFFPGDSLSGKTKNNNFLGEPGVKYSSAKNDLKNCREMLDALKDQLKDKEKIISLLTK